MRLELSDGRVLLYDYDNREFVLSCDIDDNEHIISENEANALINMKTSQEIEELKEYIEGSIEDIINAIYDNG